jgi:hypothetical protein
MIGRREFLASGFAASLFVHPSTAAVARGVAARSPSAQQFVADHRFPEARSASRAAALHGVALRPVPDDITGLYQWLDVSMRADPFPIAGITTGNTLFVIERVAWERGLRTVYRGRHWRVADGQFRHQLLGTAALTGRIAAAPESGWAGVVGSTLAAWAPGREDPSQFVTVQSIPGADGESLASWLMVPKSGLGLRV